MHRLSIQLPDDLVPVAKECIRRERLRSMAELFVNFLQHWGVSQHPFHLTGNWPALDGPDRDALNDWFSRLAAAKGSRALSRASRNRKFIVP